MPMVTHSSRITGAAHPRHEEGDTLPGAKRLPTQPPSAHVSDAEQLVAGVPVVGGADAGPLLKDRAPRRLAAASVPGVEALAGVEVLQRRIDPAGRRADIAV